MRPRSKEARPTFVMVIALALGSGWSCAPIPPGAAGAIAPTEITSGGRELGVLPIFVTDQTTDGRNVKLRGKIRNPYPEAIQGVRLMYLDIAPGNPRRVLDTALRITDVDVGPGQETPLRWDIQTMYAGSAGARFELGAFAISRGGKALPLPPGWEPGDDDRARRSP